MGWVRYVVRAKGTAPNPGSLPVASIEDFIAAVRSNIESLKQAQTIIDTAGQRAEELSTAFQSIGAEWMASGSGELKQGTDQARGSVDPIITALDDLIAQAEQFKTSTGPTPRLGRQPTPLDAAPKSLREPTAQVGDQRQAPGEAPGPFRQELTGHDEDDKTKGRAARFGRGFVRNAGDVKERAEDLGNVGANMVSDGYDPHGYGTTQETVSETRPAPTIGSTTQDVQVTDVVGTAVMLTAFAVEGVSRFVTRRRSSRRGA